MRNYQWDHRVISMTSDKNGYTPEAIKALANDIAQEGSVPTYANSIKRPAPKTPSEIDAPAPVADASC